jgi:1-acyl-sn-glycerol-3-phosphate acyltransferase
MSTRWEQWAMQRLGCFSIDRESADRKAYKQAVDILQNAPHPLVIFPEGDIYHVSDRITAFREGAAAIAIAAARRAVRSIVVVPCAIKFWYIDDPTAELVQLMEQLETRLLLRPQPELELPERIHRFAQALLALKELDYLGMTQTGSVRDRVSYLAETVLAALETRHRLTSGGKSIPERVKELRQKVIAELGRLEEQPRNPAVTLLLRDMEDLFFVMQLFSYPGDYLLDEPTVERLAETLDKFEEDVLQRDYPSVRGRRRASIRFGEPIPVNAQGKRDQVAELTRLMQDGVQGLLDELNDSRRSAELARIP